MKKKLGEQEKATSELMGALELYAKTPPMEEQQKNTTSTMIPTFSSAKKEPQNRHSQAFWKDFEIEEKKRYAVLKILGEGGMGVVELVKDQLLGREVARKTIKMQRKNTSQSSRKEEILLWRFKKEADITALLEHPHIIPLYEMQRPEPGEIQFTMRKVEGQTLRNLLHKKRTGELDLDETQILSIFRKVCDAIAYAHSKGVIHRDLKPDNVMVGQFGEVYVMDWGIAKRFEENVEEESDITLLLMQQKEGNDELYKTIGGMGTPGYMSPEQQENASSVTPQSDIYSLGKILRECFTLYSSMEELKQQAQKSLNRKHIKNEKTATNEPTIPKEIEAIEKKATQDNPKERYTSVQEFIYDLEQYQKDFKVSAKEYSLYETLQKWFKRNQQKVIVGSLLISMSIGFPLYFWIQNKRVRQSNAQKAFQQATEAKQQAETVQTSHHKVQLKEKIKYLLRAFEQIDKALGLMPENREMETLKREIGQELVLLTCQSEDYQLATYVAENLQDLSPAILSEENKQNLLNGVTMEERKLLKSHEQRFEELLTTLLNPEAGEREIAWVEIAQMGEEEIFDRILEQVKNGNDYFLKNEGRNTKQDEYYQFFATALGNTNNPKACNFIIAFLNQLCDQKLSLAQTKEIAILESLFDAEEIKYMINLVRSLGNLKVSGTSEPLKNIRFKMGKNGTFWVQTFYIQKKLISLDPVEAISMDAISFYHRGSAKKEKGDIEGAIADYTEAIRLNPNYAEAYTFRGVAKTNKKDFEGAIKDFTESICLQPNFVEAYYNRGSAKKNKGDIEEAIADYTKAIRLNPNYFDAYNNRGFAKKEKGDLKGAIADYTEAIRLNPNFATAYNNRGFVKGTMGDSQGAIADYTEAIHLNPNYAEAYSNRGLIKQNKGDLDDSIMDFNEAIRLNPALTEAYNNRGVSNYNKGDLNGALADFTETIRLNPNYTKAYNNRGRVKKDKGDLDGSIADCTEAIRLDPNSASAYNSRGLANFKKDHEKSIEDFTEAIRLNPNFATAYYNRGHTKLLKKDREGAKKDFQKYLDLTHNQSDPQIQNNHQQVFKIFPELAQKKE